VNDPKERRELEKILDVNERAGNKFGIRKEDYLGLGITQPINIQLNDERTIKFQEQYLTSISSIEKKMLTSETFVSKLNALLDKTELMISQLKTISGKDLSLTERAVASQSR
jgi:hypothetical protein